MFPLRKLKLAVGGVKSELGPRELPTGVYARASLVQRIERQRDLRMMRGHFPSWPGLSWKY